MTVTLIGLTFDIIGVIILFRFGILPSEIFDNMIWTSGMKDSDIEQHKKWSKIGLSMLLFGFILQIIGTLINNNVI